MFDEDLTERTEELAMIDGWESEDEERGEMLVADGGTEVEEQMKNLNGLVDVLLEIDEVDVPEFDVEAYVTDEGYVDFMEDEDWWGTILEISNILDNYGKSGTGENKLIPGREKHKQYDELIGSAGIVSIRVRVFANGSKRINVVFEIDGAPYEDVVDNAGEIGTDIVREVTEIIAAARLWLLANRLESPAETLDYWATNDLGGRSTLKPSLRQSSWAEIRGVSRQTVSDRVRAAREKLGN